ncbi:MAG: N-acetylmuramic acid 6-phosphate etherase [Chitinophagia bacterium]|nr:N-acetylmuramic acid 6-phosphate etherase [Chitinophagia bacterium]
MPNTFKRTTEESSLYNNIENLSTHEILTNINKEDQKVAYEVEKVIQPIQLLVDAVTEKLRVGGRLFYIGAGTSGRLGLVDASECPPTFGVPSDLVIGVIAGGHQVVVGIAASGTTPYVIGGLRKCRAAGITTGSISCNKNCPVSKEADFPIEVVVGPEFITGSTRMKSGTAQKMVLNMLSTSVMIKLGRIKGNKMVNMQLTNQKLFERGVKMIMEEIETCDKQKATDLLTKYGSVKKSIEMAKT